MREFRKSYGAMIAQVESGDDKKSRLNLACLTLLPGNRSSQRLRGGRTLAGLLGVSTATGLRKLWSLGHSHLWKLWESSFCSQCCFAFICLSSQNPIFVEILAVQKAAQRSCSLSLCQCTLLPKCISLYSSFCDSALIKFI